MSDISLIDTSIENMSEEELKNAFLTLKELNNNQTKRIEEYEQQLYENKRQLATAKAMEMHLMNEIESLLNNEDKYNSEKLSKKILSLEEEIALLKQTIVENLQNYEAELSKKDNELQSAAETLKIEQNHEKENKRDEIIKHTDEIYELKSQVELYKETLEETEVKYNEAIQKNVFLENKISEIEQDLSEIKTCLACKKLELQESNELVHDLQDQIVIMQMELDKLKSLPLDADKKGNSLFAEVDDNRKKLQSYIKSMNKKYSEMKIKYNCKSQELQKLHWEYTSLSKALEDKNSVKEDFDAMMKSHKKHVDKLTETIEFLEKELQLRNTAAKKIMCSDMKIAETMIEISRKEVLALKKELNLESLYRSLSEQSLFDAKRETKRWHTEVLQLRVKVTELTQKIEELKLMKSPERLENDESENNKCESYKNSEENIRTSDSCDEENDLRKIESYFKISCATQTTKSSLKEVKTIKKENDQSILTTQIKEEGPSNLKTEVELKKSSAQIKDFFSEDIAIKTETFEITTENVENDVKCPLLNKINKDHEQNIIEKIINLSNSIEDIDIKPENIDIKPENFDIKPENIDMKVESAEDSKDNKENFCAENLDDGESKKTKKVAFTEDTLDTKLTRPRRRGKIITAPCVFIPSAKK